MKSVLVNDKYEILVSDVRAEWDAWAAWEKPRFASMEKNLHIGDILFDVGAEIGDISSVYATFVGPENMVLFEPSLEFWPNIREVWTANFDVPPAACCASLVGQETNLDLSSVDINSWPRPDVGPTTDLWAYRYIVDHGAVTPQITIDDFVSHSGIIPTAITIDVEGAELLVLSGAVKTLETNKPKLWVSIHPDLMLRYNQDHNSLHALMTDLGYRGEYLATDHEQHWMFTA